MGTSGNGKTSTDGRCRVSDSTLHGQEVVSRRNRSNPRGSSMGSYRLIELYVQQ